MNKKQGYERELSNLQEILAGLIQNQVNYNVDVDKQKARVRELIEQVKLDINSIIDES